jgi:uncharacterized protein YegL
MMRTYIASLTSLLILASLVASLTIPSAISEVNIANLQQPPGGIIQLGLCLDDSGSISSSDWQVIVKGVAAAIRNNLPHDGSVELTIVQFSTTARITVPPTVITAANYDSIATQVEGLHQQGGSTAMAAGLNATWWAMKNSSNFKTAVKQVINLATDGMPNVVLNTSATTGDAKKDVLLVRDIAAKEGLEELDSEAIGSGADVNFLVQAVYPQPGHIAPPYIPGWVESVPDANAFATAVGNKFRIIITPAPPPPTPTPIPIPPPPTPPTPIPIPPPPVPTLPPPPTPPPVGGIILQENVSPIVLSVTALAVTAVIIVCALIMVARKRL